MVPDRQDNHRPVRRSHHPTIWETSQNRSFVDLADDWNGRGQWRSVRVAVSRGPTEEMVADYKHRNPDATYGRCGVRSNALSACTSAGVFCHEFHFRVSPSRRSQ